LWNLAKEFAHLEGRAGDVSTKSCARSADAT